VLLQEALAGSDTSFARNVASGGRHTTQPSAGPETTAAAAADAQGPLGSASRSRGSANSMDMPIPVLPGPRLTRQPCPACDTEVWPLEGGTVSATISDSTAGVPFHSSSSSMSSSVEGSLGSQPCSDPARGVREGVKCTCTCSNTQEGQSSLLNWQHEGGFWPAGPSVLLEARKDSLDEDEGSMVTTWLIQVRPLLYVSCTFLG
jgi:hypothetical protein